MPERRIPFRPMALEVLKAPSLWAEAWRAMASMRPLRASLRLVPDEAYLSWRMHTAYGDEPPRPVDVVPFLRWRRRMRRLA